MDIKFTFPPFHPHPEFKIPLVLAISNYQAPKGKLFIDP
jgi:hypothetical protein